MERKTAVITGGSSLVGHSITSVLIEENYNVLMNGPSKVKKEKSNYVMTDSNDLLIPDTAQTLLSKVTNRWDKCDVLIVNIDSTHELFINDINIEKMCESIRLKIETSYRLIYTFLKYFTTVGQGHIIVTTNAYGKYNNVLEALVESLSQELMDTAIKITYIEADVDPENTKEIAEAVKDILNKPNAIRIPKYRIISSSRKPRHII